MSDIKVAIVGVGNCASSLVQGIGYYASGAAGSDSDVGLAHPVLGGYSVGDVKVVAAIDVDARKVGRPLHEALFAPPNNTKVFFDDFSSSPSSSCDDVIVQMGAVLDGVGDHMSSYPEARRFVQANLGPLDALGSF